MIRTLAEFNRAYASLKASLKGEWFRHKFHQEPMWDAFTREYLETEFALFSKRVVKYRTENEAEIKKEQGRQRNEKDLFAALLKDAGLLSPDFPEENK